MKRLLFLVIFTLAIVLLIRHNTSVFAQSAQDLSWVRIHPGYIDMRIDDPPEHLSALGFDPFGRSINSGVYYDWSMSSTNTIGRIDNRPAGSDLAVFYPLQVGHAEITVTATKNGQTAQVSIPVDIRDAVSDPNVNEFKQLLIQYPHKPDGRYFPVDGKGNALDAGFLMKYLQ